MASLKATITGKDGEVVTTLCPPDSTAKKAFKYAVDLYVWKTEKAASNISKVIVINTRDNTIFFEKTF
jgi:hypothetical protein